MDDISKLKQVGVALGSGAYGTASGSFTRGLLVSNLSSNPGQTVEPVPEVRGTLETIRTTKGPIERPLSLAFPLDVGDASSGSVGDFLGSVYGSETPTNVGGGLYKHKFLLGNTGNPSWLNLWTDKDKTSRQIRGFMPGSVKFTVNAAEGQIPVEVEGLAQTEGDLGAQTLAFADEPIIVPSEATVMKIGGSTVNEVESAEITVMREQEGIMVIKNQRFINELVSGKNFAIALLINGINFTDETERAKFIASNTSSFELKLVDGNSNYIHFQFPETYYQTFEGPDISGEDVLRISAAMIVTGDDANHFIELQNEYNKRYDTGATIT